MNLTAQEEKLILDTKQMLRAEEITKLRNSKVIEDNEYAYIAGDLLIAENVIASTKRVIGNAKEVLHESNKRVLKG
jgi:hypothetical protein